MQYKILIIATVYRVGERIYSTIPSLHLFCDIDILQINEMSTHLSWYGKYDFRVHFNKKYGKYISNVFDAGTGSTGNSPNQLLYDLDISNYDLILYDDDRRRHGLHILYQRANKLNIPVVGCIHGAGIGYGKERFDKGSREVFDYLFVFGDKDIREHEYNSSVVKMGIPSNDALKDYSRSEDYILVTVNILGNLPKQYHVCPIQVDRNYIMKTGLRELQKEFNKEVLFSLKSRSVHPYPEEDFRYLKDIIKGDLEYKAVMDWEDDNEPISKSFIVISPPSTYAFKPIQMGIPTVLVKDSGITGQFYDFRGLVELNTQSIFDEIERQYNNGKETDFILDTVEGGVNFTSTDIFISNIKGIITSENN